MSKVWAAKDEKINMRLAGRELHEKNTVKKTMEGINDNINKLKQS